MSEIDWSEPFKPEDFKLLIPSDLMNEGACKIANARFLELLETCPKVYGSISVWGEWFWSTTQTEPDRGKDTHQARLIDVKELK